MIEDSDGADRSLAIAVKTGDRVAFETVVTRHKPGLYRFARRYVGDRDDAYDIIQDVFVSAWMSFHRFDIDQSLAAWLRAIALNKCRDYGRRRAVRRRILELFASQVEPPSHVDPGAEGEAEQLDAQKLRLLDQAIAQLPRLYKEPLLLTTISGLTQSEAARELKTTTKAIEMRVRRARKWLMDHLVRTP